MLNNKGFSLTELMIAVVIIGVLAMVAIPKFMGTTTKAKVVEFKPILMQIYSLQDAFFQENDFYAASLLDLDFTDPESKYFNYSIEGDSVSYTAKATVKMPIKDGQGNNLKNEWVSINQDKQHGGTENLKRVGRW